MPSAEPMPLDGDRRLPLGFTRVEESLYMDGLTQTCAALRRRIAELEADNSVLQQKASKALAAVAAASTAGISVSSAGTCFHAPASTARTSSCMQQQEPRSLEGELCSVSTVQRSRMCDDVGNGANRSNRVRSPRHKSRGSTPVGINAAGCSDKDGEAASIYSPRISGSLPYDMQQRFSESITRKGGSVLPSSHEDDDRMSLMSPSAGEVDVGGGGVVARREGGVERDRGESERGWAAGGREARTTSPKDRHSRGSLSPRCEDWGATRRVSAVPNRTRYSVGVSRFSLPPSMSPNLSPSKSNDGDDSASPFVQRQRGAGMWEGLTLKHPLTRGEEELTFMEFAVVGIGQAVLSGAQAVQDWGQATEVISRFPCTSGDSCGSPIDSGGGRRVKPEDAVFVDGLEDFCFPSGAAIALVEGGSGMLDVLPEDRMHLVQFTDCENTSTYGCCLTVTHVLQDPSPRLIKCLRDREKTHTAARTLQRFMRRACDLRRARRAQGANGTLPISPATAAAAAATYTGESPPTSLSLVINRFFASNQGIDPTAASSNTIANADTMDGGIAAGRRGTWGEWSSPAPTAQSRARESSTAPSPATSSTTAAGSSPLLHPRTRASPSDIASQESRSRAGGGARVGPNPFDASNSTAVWNSNGGGGNDDDDNVRVLGSVSGKPSRTLAATVPGTVPRTAPGTFSDDESESDAGHSTDRESGSGLEGAMITERFRSLAMGREGTMRRHVASGVGKSASGEGEREEISSALLRPTTQASSGTPPRRRTRTAKSGPADGGHSRSWHVLVESCYAMVSCHRNHSLMFKVLKAAADADRPTRPGSTTPSSTPPHLRAGSPGAITPDATPPTPLRLPARRGAAVVGGAEEEGAGGQGACTKESPRSASRFRSVAAAAAEEAKGRHRRMLRDRFLHQVRTDKAAIGEDKKVSIHCPAFLRAPLEVTAVPLELWATAVLLASLPEEFIVRSLDALLLEKTLAVCGRDLDMVSMVTTALLSLLEPLKWEGVFVPVVPEKLMDVLGSPVPALVGVQAPFDPIHRHAFDGVVVLDLDAPKAKHQHFTGGMEERLPVSESLLKALKNANTLAGRGRGARTPTSRSPVRDGSHHSIREGSHHRRVCSPKDGIKASGGVSSMGGRRTATSPGPRSPFAFQASTFMGGMTVDEKGTVLRLRSLVKAHVSSFCGDLHIPGNWRKYGEFSAASGEFEFCPDWFMQPLEARLKFQVGVAHTQMFVSFVDRCRIGDAEAEALNADHAAAQRRPSVSPSSPGTTCKHNATDLPRERSAPELEDDHDHDDDGIRQGKTEAISPQSGNTYTASRGASVGSSSGFAAAGLSPPPLPCRRLVANLDGAAPTGMRRGSGGGRLGASVVSPPPLPTRR